MCANDIILLFNWTIFLIFWIFFTILAFKIFLTPLMTFDPKSRSFEKTPPHVLACVEISNYFNVICLSSWFLKNKHIFYRSIKVKGHIEVKVIWQVWTMSVMLVIKFGGNRSRHKRARAKRGISRTMSRKCGGVVDDFWNLTFFDLWPLNDRSEDKVTIDTFVSLSMMNTLTLLFLPFEIINFFRPMKKTNLTFWPP